MKRKKVSKREGAMIEVFDLVSLDIDFIKSLKNLREDLDKDSPVPLNYLLEFNGETVKINYIPTENQKFMVRDFRNGGKHGNHEKEVESTADWVSLRTVDSNKPFCSGSIPFRFIKKIYQYDKGNGKYVTLVEGGPFVGYQNSKCVNTLNIKWE